MKYKINYSNLNKNLIGGNENYYLSKIIKESLLKDINDEFKKIKEIIRHYGIMSIEMAVFRVEFNSKFSYYIPNENSLSEIKTFVAEDKILEIKSGLGLWAYLLKLSNVEVKATDSSIKDLSKLYTNVEELEFQEALKKYNDYNVLMLIGKFDGNLDKNYLENFKGNKLIYIGEKNYYIPEEEEEKNAFFDELNNNWDLHKEINIPNLPEIDSKVYLYKKKEPQSTNLQIFKPTETNEKEPRLLYLYKDNFTKPQSNNLQIFTPTETPTLKKNKNKNFPFNIFRNPLKNFK